MSDGYNEDGSIREGWYEDADGDLMPASVEAWDDLFDEADDPEYDDGVWNRTND